MPGLRLHQPDHDDYGGDARILAVVPLGHCNWGLIGIDTTTVTLIIDRGSTSLVIRVVSFWRPLFEIENQCSIVSRTNNQFSGLTFQTDRISFMLAD